MTTYTATISAERLVSFRRQLIRSGGAIVMSAPVGNGGYCVTYVAQAAK